MFLPAILLVCLLVSTIQDEFLFAEPDSEIVLKFHDTAAFSRVEAWNVQLETSSAVLGVDSFVPIEEYGFWIIGFKPRSIQEITAMFNRLGQLVMLDGEEDGGFCSNLPYLYNYNIHDIILSRSLYREEKDGSAVSVFDWRAQPPFNPVTWEDGNIYNQTLLKSMTTSLSSMLDCMNDTVEHKRGASGFRAVLFHTYVHVKLSCLKKKIFDVIQCVEVMQRSSLLTWRLKTQVIVMSSVSSTAIAGVTNKHEIRATTSSTKLSRYNRNGTEVVESEVEIEIAFPARGHEYFFYIPNTFNVTGPYFIDSEGLVEWTLESADQPNFTDVFNYLWKRSEQPDREGEVNSTTQMNLTSEFYKTHLAKQEFPLSLLPRSVMKNTTEFVVTFVNDFRKIKDKITVVQEFGFIACYPRGVAGEQTCSFGGEGTTSVSTGITVKAVSETKIYSSDMELEWKATLESVLAGNGDNLSPLLSSTRALYSTESLHATFTVEPEFVLKWKEIQLLYLLLKRVVVSTPGSNDYRLYTTDSLEDLPQLNGSRSHVLYYNSNYTADIPPSVLLSGEGSSYSYGSFQCVENRCTLTLSSEVFSVASSGYYQLTIAMKLTSRSRTRRSVEEVDAYDDILPVVPTETFDLYFAFERTESEPGEEEPAGDVTPGDVTPGDVASEASRASVCFSVFAVAVLLKLSSWQ